MALSGYLTLVGEKQGAINGSVTDKGHEKTILVVAVDHQVNAPFDVTSGAATGGHQHQPLVITKQVDDSSPMLWKALVDAENMTTWTLGFWRQTVTGAQENYYSILLASARIVGIKMELLNNSYPDLASIPMLEKVAFVYQSIKWTSPTAALSTVGTWA